MSCRRENIVFYISDTDAISGREHLGKMDQERVIAENIKSTLKNCTVIKATDYDGTKITADSVGIVFPIHSYGVSLAVYSFVAGLNISRETYIYAVATGEKIDLFDRNLNDSRRNLDSFISLFERRGLGSALDVYVRVKNMKRSTGGTEQNIRDYLDIRDCVKTVMKGLVYYSMGELDDVATLPQQATSNIFNRAFDIVNLESDRLIEKTQQLTNIFLDDSVFAGVRLCQVM